MIYIVYHDKDETLLNRIGVNELGHYTNVQDFVPLLDKRGTVVEVEYSGELVGGRSSEKTASTYL